MRAHQIVNGIVVNTIEVAALDVLPGLVAAEGAIGDHYADGVFTPPEPVIPPVIIPTIVTRKQARKALALAGLFDEVQPAIDAIADPLQRRLVQIDWDDSESYARTDSTLLTLASGIGQGDAALDALFLAASGL